MRRFSWQFVAVDGRPIAYLQKLRIETAMSLLETGDLGVEEIARLVGYQDTSSFARLFRERVGLAPRAYRNRASRKPAGG